MIYNLLTILFALYSSTCHGWKFVNYDLWMYTKLMINNQEEILFKSLFHFCKFMWVVMFHMLLFGISKVKVQSPIFIHFAWINYGCSTSCFGEDSWKLGWHTIYLLWAQSLDESSNHHHQWCAWELFLLAYLKISTCDSEFLLKCPGMYSSIILCSLHQHFSHLLVAVILVETMSHNTEADKGAHLDIAL